MSSLDEATIRARVADLGDWFHNMDLGGVRTAPNHFLYDYPANKWRRFRGMVPQDLSGKSVLDIGCNGGFYSIEMKRRGADRVLGIDFDDRYLAQSRLAAEVTGQDIEFRKLSVYDVASLGERFDVVLFMGGHVPSAASAAGAGPDLGARGAGSDDLPDDAARREQGRRRGG